MSQVTDTNTSRILIPVTFINPCKLKSSGQVSVPLQTDPGIEIYHFDNSTVWLPCDTSKIRVFDGRL